MRSSSHVLRADVHARDDEPTSAGTSPHGSSPFPSPGVHAWDDDAVQAGKSPFRGLPSNCRFRAKRVVRSASITKPLKGLCQGDYAGSASPGVNAWARQKQTGEAEQKGIEGARRKATLAGRPACLLAAAVISAVVGFASSLCAEEPKPLVRELFVPFGDLSVLLENQPQRVFLSRQQYEEMLKAAKKSAQTPAPQAALIAAADYAAAIEEERAQITGTLSIDVLDDGLQPLALDLSAVGLRRATLDGKAAAIGRAPDGKLTLFVEGKGRHTLVIDVVAPLEATAALQVLAFRLPQAPAAKFRLSVPGDVEVKSGAAVASRVVDEAARVTRFELLPQPGDTSLVMTLNSRLARRQRAVVARSVLLDEVTQAYERLHATVSLEVLHQAVDQFRFVVPEGYEITQVESPLLARWAIQREPQRRVLDVRLREQTVQTVVLAISAVRTPSPLEKWTLARFEPLDVVGQMAVVGLFVEDRLDAQSLASRGMIPIDTAVLQAAIPASMLKTEPGTPPLRPVVAYYAPHGDFALSGRFAKPPAEIAVVTNVLLTLGDRMQQVRGGFLLAPKVERLFDFDFSVPAGWLITSVTAAEGQPLAFERFDAAGGTGRIHVRLSKGIVPGQDCRVYFQATATPAGWLGTWQSTEVVFPKFAVAGATRDQGAIAVDARDDMVVRPEKPQGLTSMDETEKVRYGLAGVQTSLAFRYETQDYRTALAVERTQPRLTARTISFFRVETDALIVHSEITYQIEEARARQVRFSLPAASPASISLRALDGARLKQYAGDVSAERRQWSVLLEEPRRGTLRLAVDFQQPVAAGKLKDLMLPIARAEQVAYQSGLVAVEGSAELDVDVAPDPAARRVDVGELVDAAYQPGRRLLGVWGFAGDPPPVKVTAARQPGYGLYSAIVQQAELSTAISADGVAQTAAVFRLRTKAAYLEVALPQDAELWSMLLDDKPVKPQTEQGRLLVSLPAAPANQTRSLKVVYESPILTVPVAGRVKMLAPKLLLRAEHDSAAVEVPLADLIWHLYLPSGYEVIRADGTVVGKIDQPLPAALVAGGAALAILTHRPDFRSYAPGAMALHEYTLSDDVHYRRTAKSADEKAPMTKAEMPKAAMPSRGQTVGMSSPGTFSTDFATEFGDRLEMPTDERLAVSRDGAVQTPMGRDSGARRQSEMLSRSRSNRQPAEKAPASQPMPAPAMSMGGMGGMGGGAGMPGMSGMPGGVSTNGPASGPAPAGGVPLQPQAPSGEPAYVAGKPVYESKSKVAAYKARLEGLQSLKIELQTPGQAQGQAVTFGSLGVEPALVVTLANRPRLEALGWALALSVALFGLWLTPGSLRAKTRWIVAVIAVGTLVPLVPYLDTLTLPCNMAVYAACLLIPYYLFVGFVKWSAAGLHNIRKSLARPAATTAALLVVAVCCGIAMADEPAAKIGPYVIQVTEPVEPVKVPEDAVIVPYDPDAKTGIADARQVLVPYAKYAELWNLAHPDKKLTTKAPPAPYALASGQYSATLQGNEFLLVEGRLEIDIFTDQFVSIPLALEGGALARAELDGKPAQLTVTQPAPGTPPPQAAPNAPAAATPLVMVQAAGKGRHRLELAVRLRLERRGGWRAVEGMLPAAPATALAITVPQAQTEVRLSQVADRRNYESTEPGLRIDTALGSEGRIGIQWRPKVGEAQVDRSLTAQSTAVLDIQEDGLRVVWQRLP